MPHDDLQPGDNNSMIGWALLISLISGVLIATFVVLGGPVVTR